MQALSDVQVQRPAYFAGRSDFYDERFIRARMYRNSVLTHTAHPPLYDAHSLTTLVLSPFGSLTGFSNLTSPIPSTPTYLLTQPTTVLTTLS